MFGFIFSLLKAAIAGLFLVGGLAVIGAAFGWFAHDYGAPKEVVVATGKAIVASLIVGAALFGLWLSARNPGG